MQELLDKTISHLTEMPKKSGAVIKDWKYNGKSNETTRKS